MGKGRQRCSAIGCINSYDNCSHSFFLFPKDEKRARIWAIAAGREDLITDMSNSPIKGILCGMHFKSEMFTSEKLNRLHKRATPTIFPSLEGSTRSSVENRDALLETAIKQPSDETSDRTDDVSMEETFVAIKSEPIDNNSPPLAIKQPSDYETIDTTDVPMEETCIAIKTEPIDNNSPPPERDMQLKWKNLRDAYVRHIRMRLDKYKRGKPMRSYIYNNQMSFLRRVINPRARSRDLTFETTSQNQVKREEEDEDEDAELTQEDLMEMVEHDVKSGKEKPNLEEDGEDDDEEELVTNVDPLLHELNGDMESLENDDMHFFKSLLPALQTLRTEQKLKFRIDVMELLMTYHQAGK